MRRLRAIGLVLAVLFASILVEWAFRSGQLAWRAGGSAENLSNFLLLFRLRPILLVVVYVGALYASVWLLRAERGDRLLSWLVLLLPLLFGLLFAFTLFGLHLPPMIRTTFMITADSQLGLGINVCALLGAVGLWGILGLKEPLVKP